MRYLLLFVLTMGLAGCAMADDYYVYEDGYMAAPYYAAETPCSVGGFAPAPITSTPTVFTGNIQQTGEPPVR